MGAWSYCQQCQSPMDRPSIADAIAAEQECDCGHVKHLGKWEVRSAAEAFADRLAEIEKRLGLSE